MNDKTFHRLLLRQIRKAGLSTEEVPQDIEVWKKLLNSVSTAYHQSDEDRYLIERSLEESSRELNQIIDHKNRMSSQLVQASKMASIGTLASGVAHELNNPLTAIKGYSEIAMEADSPSDSTKSWMMKIQKQVARMRAIIDHLRNLARETDASEVAEMSVVEPIQEAVNLLKNKLNLENIQLILDFPEARQSIIGNAIRLESVFQNLISNSRDAFIEKNSKSRKIDIRVVLEVDDIVIKYSDNAGGIAAKDLTRIFDAFYTTKEVGKGTGLGLALSKDIISEHNGKMSVTSVGDMTEFSIVLPRATHESAVTSILSTKISAMDHWKKIPTKLRKLLIVDDEDFVLEILSSFLSGTFEVVTTSQPLEVENLMNETKFDCLITDVKMPGKSGFEVAESARKIHQTIPIVFMSGHIVGEMDEDIKRFDRSLFLSKPFEDKNSVKLNIVDFIQSQLNSNAA